MDCKRDIEAVERGAVITPAFDVKDQHHVAHSLGGSGGERRGLRDQAWTYNVAITVFEIIAREMPLRLGRHRSLLLVNAGPVSRRRATREKATTFKGWSEGDFHP